MSYEASDLVFYRFQRVKLCGLVFVLSLFLVHPYMSRAQLAPQTDSLKTLLQESTGEQRVEVLLELSDQIRRISIDSAITYASESVEISNRIEDESLKAQSLNNLGWLLTDAGKYPEALKHLLQAKTIFEQIGDLHKEALVLQNLGKLYRSQSDYSRTLEYYFSALNLEERLNNKERIANILLSIGSLYYQMNQPGESIEFYRRALTISELTGNMSDIAIIATDLGSVYSAIDSTQQAVEAYKRALDASEQLPGAHAKATILMNLSSVYNDNNSYRQALQVNNQALALAREMSDKMLESWALKNIALTYRGLGDYSNANNYLLEARPLLKEIGQQENVVKNLNSSARNYFDMGELEKSIEKGAQAFEAAASVSAFELGIESLNILKNAYQQVDDYQNAVMVQDKIMAFKDSIYDAEQSRQIAQMQTRYETKQKEQEIALLQKEQEKAQLIRNAFIAGLTLIFIISLLIYNRQRLKIKKNQTDLENIRLKEQQLKQDLAFKNKQLTTHSLNLVQKNEVMKELKENINQMRPGTNGKIQKKLSNLEHLADYSFNLDEDWKEFKLYFEEVHTGFFDALKDQYPDLTSNELRLSALVKLNLTTKEIATIIGITPDSVKTARYRLRKKLNMQTEENLTDFMMDVERDIQV